MTALLVACLPTIFIGIMTYTIGVKQIENEVFRTNTEQAANTYQRVDEEFSRLETVFAQWAFNPSFDQTLRNMDLRNQFDRTYEVLQILLQMKSSNTFVKDVYLFLQNQDVIISDHTGVVQIVGAAERQEYEALLRSSHTIFWTNSLERHAASKNTSRLSLVIRVPGAGVDSFGAIIVSFDESRIASLIGARYATLDGTAILMREDGSVLSAMGTKERSGLEQRLAKYVAGKLESSISGSEIIVSEGKRYVVSFTMMTRANEKWVYVTSSSFDALIRPVQWTSRLIILSGFAGLAVAVMLSWIASRRLSRPLNQLLGKLGVGPVEAQTSVHNMDEFSLIEERWTTVAKESQHLQSQLDRHLPSLREGFLLQLFQGRFAWLREEELRPRMEQIGWELSDRSFIFIAGRLYGLGKPESRFTEGDEQLVSFAAVNIAGELAAERMPNASTVNFQDLSFGVLIPLDEERSPDAARAELFRYSKMLADMLQTVLKIHAVLVVTKPMEKLSELAELVDDTRQALRYREWVTGQEVIGVEDLLPGGYSQDGSAHSWEYPFEEEREVIQALRMGRSEETEQAIGRFFTVISDMQGISGQHVSRCAVQLFGGMTHAMLQGGIDPYELVSDAGSNPYEQLHALHSSADLEAWLLAKLVRPYMAKLESQQNVQVKLLIEQAIQILRQEYRRDLSLEECADRLGTYPQKLSITFKQVTGFTYIDYLTRLRLDKAKELLVETEMKVNDIAEAVGYQPSYFNRIFKKHEGVTPGQYREQQQG